MHTLAHGVRLRKLGQVWGQELKGLALATRDVAKHLPHGMQTIGT